MWWFITGVLALALVACILALLGAKADIDTLEEEVLRLDKQAREDELEDFRRHRPKCSPPNYRSPF